VARAPKGRAHGREMNVRTQSRPLPIAANYAADLFTGIHGAASPPVTLIARMLSPMLLAGRGGQAAASTGDSESVDALRLFPFPLCPTQLR